MMPSTAIWVQFVSTALVIVVAGVRLARYGDVLGEKTRLGRNWIGVVLLAATTSLPELFTGFGATALTALPDIALGDVFGSCMFNLLILSLMDAVQPEPLSARAHQGHALSIGFGLVLIGIAGIGLVADSRLPAIGWIGLYSPALIALYFVAMRVIFRHERHQRAQETREVAAELHYGDTTLRSALLRYCLAAIAVVAAALWLPVVRVLDADMPSVVRRAHVRPMDFTGKPLRGFVSVAPPAVATNNQLLAWIRKGLGLH